MILSESRHESRHHVMARPSESNSQEGTVYAGPGASGPAPRQLDSDSSAAGGLRLVTPSATWTYGKVSSRQIHLFPALSVAEAIVTVTRDPAARSDS